MKKYLFVRICAVITIVIVLLLFGVSLYNKTLDVSTIRTLEITLAVLFMFSFPVMHSIQVLLIYKRWYPDKEISTGFKRLYIITGILAILSLLFYCVMIFSFFTNPIKWTMGMKIVVTQLQILSTTLTVQIVGCFRLMRAISRNVKLQLENSFT